MTKSEAAKIGSKQGLRATGIGLLIAQLIMTLFVSLDEGFLKGVFWFISFDYKLNVTVGAAILLLSGYFFGRIAGKMILIQNHNHVIIGVLSGMAVLITTACLSGVLGFIQEGWRNIGTEDNPIEDYIFKPLYWISIFGFIPAIFVGLWFSSRIKRQRNSVSPT